MLVRFVVTTPTSHCDGVALTNGAGNAQRVEALRRKRHEVRQQVAAEAAVEAARLESMDAIARKRHMVEVAARDAARAKELGTRRREPCSVLHLVDSAVSCVSRGQGSCRN